jgi:hypothetical protein
MSTLAESGGTEKPPLITIPAQSSRETHQSTEGHNDENHPHTKHHRRAPVVVAASHGGSMTITRLQIPLRRNFAHAQVILLASALSLWSIPALTQAPPERVPDNDVKTLIDQVDEGRDKFEGNLDGEFKGSTLRGPSGETKVAAALQDYQDNVKKLKERFNQDYSASAEVATVLKQATSIDKFMQATPSVSKGRSEWDRQAASLKQLAEVYGTTFPTPEGATARRMNDKETAAAAADIAAAADRFKSDLDKASTLPKPDKDAAKKDVEVLIKQANAVKSRTSDGKPATAELRQLVEQVAKLQTLVAAHQIPTAMTNWQTVQTALGKLQQAFGPTT